MLALLRDGLWRMRMARHLCVLIVAAGAIVALVYIVGVAGLLR